MPISAEYNVIYQCEPPHGPIVTEDILWQGRPVQLRYPDDHKIQHALYSGRDGTTEIAFWLSPYRPLRRVWCMEEPSGDVSVLGKVDSIDIPEIGKVVLDSLYGNRVTFERGALEKLSLASRFDPSPELLDQLITPTLLISATLTPHATVTNDYPNPERDYQLVYGDRSFYSIRPARERMRIRVLTSR
jgi:hypothetical protein